MVRQIKGLGYRTVLGCVYPHDPFVSISAVNSWHVLNRVCNGSVIILHDRRDHTADTLMKVLPALRTQGYRVLSLSRAAQRQSAAPATRQALR